MNPMHAIMLSFSATLSTMLSVNILTFGLLIVSAGVVATPGPPTIKLMSRKIFHLKPTYSQKRSLSMVNVPLDDFFKGTDLQCAYIQFV